MLQRVILQQPKARILDFGCGDSGGIEWGRRHGVEVLGTDLRLLPDEDRYFQCTPTSLPFENHAFDAIVSNMVFEHVMHPEAVLKELRRVLRPGGIMVHMWPSSAAVFEGHCRLLFAQNLRSRTYLRLCHRLGFGVPVKGSATSAEFATGWLHYMDEKCNYLPEAELRRLFVGAGFSFSHREHEYLRYRLGFSAPLLDRALRMLTTMVIMSEPIPGADEADDSRPVSAAGH
jgi:SAM-dependent methyltransferase